MSEFLNFNNYSLFKQPLSKPIFYYDNPINAKTHYQQITNDNRYDFQYDVLANQDIAIDLLHAGILADREMHVNNYKKAAAFSPLKNASAYDALTDASKNILRKYGIYLDVSNNVDKDTYYLIQNSNIGTSQNNIITEIANNRIKFSNSKGYPLCLPQHRENENYEYRGADISNSIYQSIFSVGDNIEIFHDTKYYKNLPSAKGRKYLKIINDPNDMSYNIEFIAGIQGTTNMIINPYNDNGILFSSVDQIDSSNKDFSGWELFTNREDAHEHYSSIIPFNTKITVSEPEHLLFQSDLNDLFDKYQTSYKNDVITGAHLIGGYSDIEQRIKNNLELFAIDSSSNLILKGNSYFRNDKTLKDLHGIWDKTITQNSNFDLQEYMYYFKHNSSSTPSGIQWDTNNDYTWVTHNTYGLNSQTQITAPDLTDNNSSTFKIPNYGPTQTEFNSLEANMYNPDNPRSEHLIQKEYTVTDIITGNFIYNTFNKFYPRAEPLVEMYVKNLYKYDSKFKESSVGLLPKIATEYDEPIYHTSERDSLTSDISYNFILNNDDNQYYRLYRNSYLNYAKIADISYATGYNSDSNIAYKNIEGSTETYNQNTQNKHSGNMTIGSFKPQINDTILNHSEWNTKGKEVMRYALFYTNDPNVSKPTLKPEYHGTYWKMTNYQGWTNETDISNSAELSSMIFHYERDKIGFYRSGLYYNNTQPTSSDNTNWEKWRIGSTTTFNNYDDWIYQQKQDILHTSLVICNYDDDIFFNGVIQIELMDDNVNAYILSKGKTNKFISHWNIETGSLISKGQISNDIVNVYVSKNIDNNERNIFFVSERPASSPNTPSFIFKYKYNEGTKVFQYNHAQILDYNTTDNVNTNAFLVLEIDSRVLVIFENNNHTNNAISYNSSVWNSGSIINEICNNNSRIIKYQYDVIDGYQTVIFMSEHDLTLWNWTGTDLYNKKNFLTNTNSYTKNIGNILTDASFNDIYLKDNNTLLTTVKSGATNYNLVKWRINNNNIDISDSVTGTNNSIFSFNSDVSGVKIAINKYYDTASQNTYEYEFLNIVSNNSKNLIGISGDSTDWDDNNNRIELTNMYDFSVNLMSTGTNNTSNNDYSIIYTTEDDLNQRNKKIYKIKLSDYYTTQDPNTLHNKPDIIEDSQIDSSRKTKPFRKGFTQQKYDNSGLFIAFANETEMPSSSWIYSNFGLDWQNPDDWDDLLEFYHAFTETATIYVDNSPGSEYFNKNILDIEYYNNKTFTGIDSVFNTQNNENNDISFQNIGHPKMHWSGEKGEYGMGLFPVFQFDGRIPETAYELGHLDKIVNKIRATNERIQIFNDTEAIQSQYIEKGTSQYKQIINSEPWKLEKTMWWEVKVPDNIEALTGITYQNALLDKKYYIQFAKDYPEYGFNKDEFIHWDNQSVNYRYFSKYASEKQNKYYFPLKTDRFGGYPINRKIEGDDFLNITKSRNVNSREYQFDTDEPVTSALYVNEKTHDKDGNEIDKVYLVTQYISAFFYPKDDVSGTELTVENMNNNMDIYYFTNINIPSGTIKDCIKEQEYYTPTIKSDDNGNTLYLQEEINISGWKHYDSNNDDFFNFKEELYDVANNIAYNIGLNEVFRTGLSNETLTDILNEGLKDDKVVYNQVTKIKLSNFTAYSGIDGIYQYNNDLSYNNRWIFNNNNGNNYKIKYDISYGWSIYNDQDVILYNDLSHNRKEQTVNLQPNYNLQFTDIATNTIVGSYEKTLDFERRVNLTPKDPKTGWSYLNDSTDLSYSNANWIVERIDKGMVFLTYNDPNNINDTVNGNYTPKYVSVISNIYKKIESIPNTTEVDICNVYWVDEPTSFNDGYGYNANFDISKNAQIPLIDLSINNTIYTIENKLIGLGGFNEIIDMSNELLYTFNYANDTVTTPDDIRGTDAQSPHFDNNPLTTYNYYSLTNRYDKRSIYNVSEVKQPGYLSSLHDKLYYDHDWSRLQSEDNWTSGSAAKNYSDNLKNNYPNIDLSFETVFAVLENNNDNSRNVLFTDLSDITFSDMKYPYKREQFTYEFPYLFYEYSDSLNADKITEIKGKYTTSIWDNFNFRDVSNTDGIVISSAITSQTLTTELAEKYGKETFRIDLLDCQIRLAETTFNDISNGRGKYRHIKELGQLITESEYLIKANLYGKHTEDGKDYLVFKYKEPANYAENPIENRDAYKQYNIDSTTQLVTQKSVFPDGGDRYRSLIGLKNNYTTTGTLTCNSDIACRVYIPVKINFGYKYNTISYNQGDNTSHLSKKIVNTFSNGTNVYLLKINTLLNNSIINTSLANEKYNMERTIEEEVNSVIDIPVQARIPRLSYNYHLGSNIRPIKYLIDYNNVSGLAGELAEINSTTATYESIINFKANYNNKELITYFPLDGSEQGSWTRSRYNTDSVIIDQEAFINYVNSNNIHDNSKLKPYLYLLKSKPVSSQYGSKVHNYYYEPINYTDGSEINSRSAVRSITKIISPLDLTDGSSNLAEDLNGNITFNIDEFGVFYLKFTPKTFNISSYYSIPYTFVEKGTNIESEGNISINLIAKYLIVTDGIEKILTDSTTQGIVFDLPYKINSSAIDFQDYSNNGLRDNEDITNYIYDNLSFEIYSTNSVDLETIGTFEFDPNGDNTKNKVKFVPLKKYLTLGLSDNSPWDPFTIINNLKYRVLFNSEEYINRVNDLTLRVTNTYHEPIIINSTNTINTSDNNSVIIRFTDIIQRDESMDLIEMESFSGPYSGSMNIIESENSSPVGYKSIEYTPDSDFVGTDYISFTIHSKNTRDQNTNQLTNTEGQNISRGYIRFIVTSSDIVEEPEPEPESEEEENEIVEEVIEIRPCPKEIYKPMVTATVDPRSTLADWVSQRARYLHYFPKKQLVITRNDKDKKDQISRKVAKIKNF